jgi:hypothetical protein
MLTFNGAPPYHTRHHPRKRVIQYSRADAIDSRGRGVLDSPPSRGMTADLGARTRPYSAGLASGGGGLAEGGVPAAVLAAAAFFSTMATATIAPS